RIRSDCAAAVCNLVLACVSNCAEILSASFLRCRRDSNRKFLVVLACYSANCHIEPYVSSRSHCAHRFIRPAVAGSKIFSSFPLVAGSDDPLHNRRGLWQSPPMVPTSYGADRRWICRGRLRFFRIENLFASCRDNIVNPVGKFICNSFVHVRATTLRIVCCSTSRRWSGTKQNH